MAPAPTTLNEIISELEMANPDGATVFSTSEGEISGGYHITELKLASIQGIDCGGRMADWTETHLQLLDGQSGRHMSVQKLKSIANHSAKKLPGLADAPIYVEYAPGNDGLRRYLITSIMSESERVVISLREDGAKCKPAEDRKAGVNMQACCGEPMTQTARCC
ncbi:MAG: DUF6428 family protein [Paracoccaceae bacterium]